MVLLADTGGVGSHDSPRSMDEPVLHWLFHAALDIIDPGQAQFHAGHSGRRSS